MPGRCQFRANGASLPIKAKNTGEVTLIQPPATVSLREKEIK